MEKLLAFAAHQNVTHFRTDLENGAEGERRATLLRLLVEEEDKLGLTREQLTEVEHQIARIKAILATQIETIATLRANGHGQSLERAERAVSNIIELLVAHENRRAKIEAALSKPDGR